MDYWEPAEGKEGPALWRCGVQFTHLSIRGFDWKSGADWTDALMCCIRCQVADLQPPTSERRGHVTTGQVELQDQHTTLVCGGGAGAWFFTPETGGPVTPLSCVKLRTSTKDVEPWPANHIVLMKGVWTSRTSRFTSEILWTCEYLPLSQETQRRTRVMKASVRPSVGNPLQQVGVVTLPESSLVRRDSLVQ